MRTPANLIHQLISSRGATAREMTRTFSIPNRRSGAMTKAVTGGSWHRPMRSAGRDATQTPNRDAGSGRP